MFQDAVMRMLAKRPEDRLWRWCRRKPALAAAGGLALVSTIAAIVILSISVILVKQQLSRSEGLLYASQIASALREGETNNVSSAWQNLNATRGDLRGWEYNYLFTLFNQHQTTLKGHTQAVLSVAFSPDGQRIVSGSVRCLRSGTHVINRLTSSEPSTDGSFLGRLP